ncbi:MAG: hypothetical protein JRK53_07165 [Deltaproteobacteria bacterium]|nr:hypothetical protein [Deltaproteobacteria bacterium]
METENCGKFETYALSDEDRIRIMEVFEEDVIPKLTKLHARLGIRRLGDSFQVGRVGL